MAATWGWDETTSRYRDGSSGKFLSRNAVVTIRDDIVEAASKQANGFASRVANGSMSPGEFGAEMRKLVKTTELANFSLGRGGINAMTPADYGTLGRELKEQYKAIDGFVRAIEAKDMTPEAIEARANLYFEQSIKAHEMGKAAALGAELPPEYPPVHVRCACSLRWEVEDGENVAYWVLGDRPCEICSGLADQYQPWRAAA